MVVVCSPQRDIGLFLMSFESPCVFFSCTVILLYIFLWGLLHRCTLSFWVCYTVVQFAFWVSCTVLHFPFRFAALLYTFLVGF